MKKILAAAIAAAIVPMAAAADTNNVTVYGKVHVSIDSIDNSGSNIDSIGDIGDRFDNDVWEVRSRASRLGFKGSEDLGNGLKAIWQYEVSYSVDGKGQATGGTGFGSARNSYLGLASDWGTFLVGRHDTPMKVAFYAAGVEELGDSILDLNSGPNGLFDEFRANNAIAYISPSFGGFTFAGAIVPGEDAAPCGSDDCDGIADHWSVGAMFSGLGGLKASLGYESKNWRDVPNAINAGFGPTLTVGDDDETIWQAGASYTMNAFKIGAMYQDVSSRYSVEDLDYSAWAINATFKFGNTKLIGQYGQNDWDVDGVDDADVWGIGVEHMFSKRTSVYAAYADSDGATLNAFDNENVTFGVSDQSAFSVGMIHSF